MKPAAFDYHAPSSITDAIALLADTAQAKVLAGGQSLIPLMAARKERPRAVVDLRNLRLEDIIVGDGVIRIGAMATQADVQRHPELRLRCPLVHEAIAHVAHPQIRARGTIGGSVAHGDPAAELPATFVTLDGTALVAGPNGRRTIAARDFYLGDHVTALLPDEILTAIELPIYHHAHAACYEIAARSGYTPAIAAMAQVELANGDEQRWRTTLFAAGSSPTRLRGLEQVLPAVASDPCALRAAVAQIVSEIHMRADHLASAKYRTQLAPVVVARAVAKASAAASLIRVERSA